MSIFTHEKMAFMFKDVTLAEIVDKDICMQFEKYLQTHAQIENEILFPKALLIEQSVREKFGKSQLN
jgi:hypothetical protein